MHTGTSLNLGKPRHGEGKSQQGSRNIPAMVVARDRRYPQLGFITLLLESRELCRSINPRTFGWCLSCSATRSISGRHEMVLA